MGYFGKIQEKQKATELRKMGFSYGEILKEVSVSKDTVSRWCRDIVLTKKQTERLLKNKSLGQRKGSLVAADNKRRIRIQRTINIFEQAKKDLGKLSKRDMYIAGIALYAGEGNKSDREAGFANTDPRMIKFMMKWFRSFCAIPNSRMRGALWLHEGLDEQRAVNYWSKLTGIPLVQFHKTYIAKNKENSNKIRKNIHPYGVFSVRFSDAEKQRQIMGWIWALLGGKMPPVR